MKTGELIQNSKLDRRFTVSLAFLLAVIALGITATSAIAQQGKDTGFGFCPLHKLNYKGSDCPRCLANPGNRGNNGGNRGDSVPSLEQMRQQQQEEAEQQQRQRAEQERLAKERMVEQERRQREIEFQETQATLLKSLKGVGTGGLQLKTAGTIIDNNPRGFGLKGLGDTGIKNVAPDRDARDLGGAESAWKQLNAAAYLAKTAARQSDPTEMLYLATEVTKVMNGETLGVSLPKAPPMPRPPASATPGAEYREATKLILAEVSRKAAEFKEKTRVAVELARKKTEAAAATKVAQETLEKAQSSAAQAVVPAVVVPAVPVATATEPPPKPKPSALEEARAALLKAQQAEAEANRVAERADAEAKFEAQKINEGMLTLDALNQRPELAADMIKKLQGTAAAK